MKDAAVGLLKLTVWSRRERCGRPAPAPVCCHVEAVLCVTAGLPLLLVLLLVITQKAGVSARVRNLHFHALFFYRLSGSNQTCGRTHLWDFSSQLHVAGSGSSL